MLLRRGRVLRSRSKINRRNGSACWPTCRCIQKFRQKLQALGWVEGKNLIIEYRNGEGRDDRFPAPAAELVSMPVDVLVVWGNPAAFAAKHATTTIPILIGAAGDVVNTGLVSNLARPDPNLTGFIALNVDLEGKRAEWLKEVMPRLSRIAVLTNPGNPISRLNVDIARQAAEKLGVKIEVVEAKNAAEVDGALAMNSAISLRLLNNCGKFPHFIRFENTPTSAGCSSMAPTSLFSSSEPLIIWTSFLRARKSPTCPCNKPPPLS